MITPSVSVILPTYNRALLIQRAIRSVLSQSYRDLELIVVDDGSTDETKDVLDQMRDPRLRVILQSENRGPCVARNAGIRASRGRYIAFQDSDSEWLPEKLRKQVAHLEGRVKGEQDVAACYSRFAVVCGGKRVIQPKDPVSQLSGHIYRRLLLSNTMDTAAIVIRRDVLELIGYFDESLRNLEDWDLALRISLKYPVAFLDEVTIFSYITAGSVNVRLAPESKVAILRKHYQAYQGAPEAMAPLTWSIGADYAACGDRDEAVRYMRLSLGLGSTAARRILQQSVEAGLNPYPALRCAHSLWRRSRLKAATFTRNSALLLL